MIYMLKIPMKSNFVPQNFQLRSESWTGSRSQSWSGFYFKFRYQNYILCILYVYFMYVSSIYRILFGSPKSFKTYCVHGRNHRQTEMEKNICFEFYDKQNPYFHHKYRIILLHDYNTLYCFMLRMRWESKNIICDITYRNGFARSLRRENKELLVRHHRNILESSTSQKL